MICHFIILLNKQIIILAFSFTSKTHKMNTVYYLGYSPYSLGPYRSVWLDTSRIYVKISEYIDFYLLITILAVVTAENLQLFHNMALNVGFQHDTKPAVRHLDSPGTSCNRRLIDPK